MKPDSRSEVCVVVADSERARFFSLEPGLVPGKDAALVEDESLDCDGAPAGLRHSDRDAGPRHPYTAQRETHRLDLQRRFAREVVERAAMRVRGWKAGLLILVAEPRMLGLMREPLRGMLSNNVRLKEIARDYTAMAPAELQRQLQSGRVLEA